MYVKLILKNFLLDSIGGKIIGIFSQIDINSANLDRIYFCPVSILDITDSKIPLARGLLADTDVQFVVSEVDVVAVQQLPFPAGGEEDNAGGQTGQEG